ncbi:MAG: hypothetical protein U0237_11330 [Thermoleophilia bacterium]
MSGTIGAPPATLPATRLALHRLAVYVISPWREARTGRIGLRATPGGFGTPFTGDANERVRVVPEGMVVETGDLGRTVPFTSLAGAAAALGMTPALEAETRFDVPPPGDPEAPLAIDPAAVAHLAAWYALGNAVLEDLRAAAGPGDDPSEVQLWPEHFDIATEIGPDGRRGGFGFSPGDDGHPLPYLYGLPWTRPEPGDPFWDDPHFRGRSLGIETLLTTGDHRAATLAFLTECRMRIAGAS